MQTQCSFKVRGVVNMMAALSDDTAQRGLVTMSAGNFGRTFSFVCQQ